ncbi:hypothetical protein Taro_018490 [Colocasia esculenta]|uniref:Uncharacterized protein n=1 Tax=Colocasia esculenta TaxID=4460 RepID=A0A843UQV8_COLES|nr:hypothetical protein [Colocasia esculenta]
MAAERAQLRDMQQTIQQLTQALLQAAGARGNQGAGDLYRNFRNLNPPRFSGTTDPDEAENWMKEIERIFCVMQCLAPLDIQTYAKMVKKAQLLEDATDLTDRIKGGLVKKEPASGSSSKPTNDKKQPFNITGGPNQERKLKIPTTPNTDKIKCEHCDKPDVGIGLKKHKGSKNREESSHYRQKDFWKALGGSLGLSSVDTIWFSVDTLSRPVDRVHWELGLVST